MGRENFPVSVFYPLCEHLVEGWEQVPVAVQCHGDAGVAQAFLDGLGVCTGCDSKGHGAVQVTRPAEIPTTESKIRIDVPLA